MFTENEVDVSRYAEFLLRKRIASSKTAPFYVQWVRRFLAVPAVQGVPLGERIDAFVESLRQRGREDWQLEQAERAIRIYFHTFQSIRVDKGAVARVVVGADGSVNGGALLEALQSALRVRNYAYRTEGTYLDWTKRFLAYLDESGHGGAGGTYVITAERVREYLTYLVVRRQVSASTQNQAFSAILFLCREVMGVQDLNLETGVRARRGSRLPTVLSVEEVRALFARLHGRARLMAELLYGGGLRVLECCRLRVKDLDFDSHLIIVRAGKGDKDRSTLLAQSAVNSLKDHLQAVKRVHAADLAAGVGEVWLPNALARKYPNAGKEWAWQYVFPSSTLSTDPRTGVVRRHHVSDSTLQKAVRDAAREAQIAKPASVHTLRHSFATHLLLHGVDIRQIQDYLGHANVETTMTYTHVVKDLRHPATSPLDLLRDGARGSPVETSR